MQNFTDRFTILLLLLFCTLLLKAQIYSLDDIHRLHAKGLSIDVAFGIKGNAIFEKDTLEMKGKLAPLHDLYTQGKHEFRIAYYVLLAEGYAAYYDGLNDRSAHYFGKARELAESNPNKAYELLVDIRQGNYYFIFRDISAALPYFLKADHNQQYAKYRLMPQAGMHTKMMGAFFGYIGNYEKAISLYQKAGRYDHVTIRDKIDAISAAGVYSMRIGKLDSAEKHYYRAMSWAQKSKDSVWIGILQGNLGNIDLKRGDTTSALDRIKLNFRLSQKYSDPHDAMRTALQLGLLHAEMKKWDQAEEYLNLAKIHFKDRPFFLEYKTNALKLHSDILFSKGRSEEALSTLQRYILLRDSLQQRVDNDNIIKVIWQTELEHHERAILQTEILHQKNKIIYFTVAGGIVLILCLSIVLLNRSRQRVKIRALSIEREQLKLHLQKKQVDDMLDKAQQSMKIFVKTIEQNDQQIERLKQELLQVDGKSATTFSETQSRLNEMLESHVMTDDRWYKFKSLFNQVYPNFLEQQRKNTTGLTEANLRMLVFQHLDLGNKTIANLLGISIQGVKKAKVRLKRKIENQV